MSAVPGKVTLSWRTCPEVTGKDAEGKDVRCGKRHKAAIADICPEHLMAAAVAFWVTMGCAVPDVTPKPAPPPPAPPNPPRRERRNRKGKRS